MRVEHANEANAKVAHHPLQVAVVASVEEFEDARVAEDGHSEDISQAVGDFTLEHVDHIGLNPCPIVAIGRDLKQTSEAIIAFLAALEIDAEDGVP